MTKKKITDPQLQLQEWQAEKKRLEDGGPKSRETNARLSELAEKIEGAFMAHYHLKHGGRLVGTFFAILRSRIGHEHSFDHCTDYTTPLADGLAYVITSQPYHDFEHRDAQALAQRMGATYINTNKWVWWYPGSTGSFTLIFPRSVVLKVRKLRGDLRTAFPEKAQ